MKVKLSLSRAEAIALLSAVPECNRFIFWCPKFAVQRAADQTICKIFFIANNGQETKNYTLTPEMLMRGANLAIQPDADVYPLIKDAIKDGKFFSADIVLDTVIQFAVFGKVVYK